MATRNIFVSKFLHAHHLVKTTAFCFSIPFLLLFYVVNETTTSTTRTPCISMPWSNWTPCSRTCGIGVKTRTRNASISAGCDKEPLIEQQSCVELRCQCVLDEAFYRTIFKKAPSADGEYSNDDIGLNKDYFSYVAYL
jgi:hypothetical protein